VEFANAFQEALMERTESSTNMPVDFQFTNTKKITSVPTKESRIRLPYLIGTAVLVLAAFIIFKPTAPAANAPTGTEAASHDVDHAVPTQTGYAAPSNPVLGLLRFQDGAATLDQVKTTARAMLQPGAGQQYEVWLIEDDGEQRRSLGVLKVDANGEGSLTFVDPQGRNLLERYNKFEITVETDPDPSPNPSTTVAYAAELPPEGLKHVRHLLVSFGATPGKIGLVNGLLADATTLDEAAQNLLAAYEAGSEANTRSTAEGMLNILVGSQSPDYKDWDGDGQIADFGDGFGFLLNGDNVGYLQGTYSHADYAVTAADATENMKIHGEHVKIAAQNLEEWAPQLRELLKQIAAAPFDSEVEPLIRRTVALADEILLGTDLNGDEKIDPIPGEGGAVTAYQHAFYMADMVVSSSDP
jgi:hypothetical protein